MDADARFLIPPSSSSVISASLEQTSCWNGATAPEIGLSGITLPEIISAFCRLHCEARITDTQYRQLKSLLLADIEDAALCDFTPAVLARAVPGLEINVLRGMGIGVDS